MTESKRMENAVFEILSLLSNHQTLSPSLEPTCALPSVGRQEVSAPSGPLGFRA